MGSLPVTISLRPHPSPPRANFVLCCYSSFSARKTRNSHCSSFCFHLISSHLHHSVQWDGLKNDPVLHHRCENLWQLFPFDKPTAPVQLVSLKLEFYQTVDQIKKQQLHNVICRGCHKQVKSRGGGSTTNLFHHLRQWHKLQYQECVKLRATYRSPSCKASTTPPKKKKKIFILFFLYT